ncbi:hypothetical protein IWW55_001160 [Coemansia sp. RSA 2706]|nr:hypothetical protein IWW55_001160 [Coemansia sp. RSA 2706]KAJ2315400.1 hypothetical protein IWW54_000309 [Coemansia sp. RSA 2705]KAJ2329100.1 hypothetical protein IWW51_000808 [Coemansia sp. RSA 2702]
MAEHDAQPVVCLEFFSGIGGLHYGLRESGVNASVAMSFDMNELANSVYTHNFHMRPSNKAIDYLEPRDIDRHRADCWLLSPPCQPYTRGGNYRDHEDPRARGLLHLLGLLPRLEHVPNYVLLENVMNFENSRSRVLLVEAFGRLGFEIHECLLSPVQFGIPNNRLRYYLVAQRALPSTAAMDTASDNEAYTQAYLARGRDVVHTEWPFGPAAKSVRAADIIHYPLSGYIDPAENGTESLCVPECHILKRKNLRFDIVKSDSCKTSTFTKAYGSKHLIGSGSLLQTKRLDVVEDGFGAPERLLDLGLRFFSPAEVARLHCFPTSPDMPCTLEFPSYVSQRQRLQLLGNSLNVHVVAQLLKHVLFIQ